MPVELQNGLIALAVVALGYIGGWLQNRNQRAKQRTEFERQKATIEAEAEAQNAKNQEAIRQTLTYHVNQIGRLDTDLREVRLKLGKAQDELNSANRKLDDASAKMDTYKENLEAAEQTIKALGDKIIEKERESLIRDENLKQVNERLATLELERNTLKKQLDQRDGELKAAKQTVTEQHAELKALNDKVDRMQAQIEVLQKHDTDKLSPDSVPDVDPAAPPTPQS